MVWQVRLRTAISPYTLLYFRVQGATIKLTHTLIETRFQKPAVKGAIINHTHTHTHTRLTAGFSGTTQVSRYQKGKTNLDFTGARDSEWQWHQLGHMQICTSLQTNNHASTPPLSFYRPDALPAAQPTASKQWRDTETHHLQTDPRNATSFEYQQLLDWHLSLVISITIWRKLIKDVWWSVWVWVGGCFFWYRPSQTKGR